MAASIRRSCGAFALLGILLWAKPTLAQSLDVRLDGDRLRIAVTNSRLIAGEALERLHDGASVTYVVRVSALTTKNGRTITSAEFRFVVSFDIFEEKFQVTRTAPSPRVVSHLSLSAAEAACVDGLDLTLSGISPSMPFWIRWEFEAEAPQGGQSGGLGGLVDLFSRKNSKEPVSALVESGPYRLADLPRVAPPQSIR